MTRMADTLYYHVLVVFIALMVFMMIIDAAVDFPTRAARFLLKCAYLSLSIGIVASTIMLVW